MNYRNFNIKFRSGQSSGIYKDFIRYLVNNNPQITAQEITQRLYFDNSTSFFYLKNLEHTLELGASEMGHELLGSPNIYRKRFKKLFQPDSYFVEDKPLYFCMGKTEEVTIAKRG